MITKNTMPQSRMKPDTHLGCFAINNLWILPKKFLLTNKLSTEKVFVQFVLIFQKLCKKTFCTTKTFQFSYSYPAFIRIHGQNHLLKYIKFTVRTMVPLPKIVTNPIQQPSNPGFQPEVIIFQRTNFLTLRYFCSGHLFIGYDLTFYSSIT